MGDGVLGSSDFETLLATEGELLFGRGEVERGLADLVRLDAREQFGGAGHNNKINGKDSHLFHPNHSIHH